MTYEKIEAQIIVLRARADYLSEAPAYAEDFRLHMDAARSLQAMLDVVRAAEGTMRWYDGAGDIREVDSLSYALDKLREMTA